MKRIPWGRLATGGVIVAIGLFLLAITTDTVEADSVWAVVPALFVLLGGWALVRSGFRNLVGPVMVIAIAGAFLLESLNLIGDEAIGTWWPLFVVLFGVVLVIDRLAGHRRSVSTDGGQSDGVAFFGTAQRRPSTDRFEGSDLVAFFGDSRLDLRDSTVGDGPSTVDVVVMFGDAEIRVPEGWRVDLKVDTVFGEAVDSRRSESGTSAETADVVVTGLVLFGDLEIRD